MANTIDSSLLLSNNQTQRNTGSSSLGKDEFLKILMTQLQNQDPLNPMEDKDFIAQMATFSSLEQMTNMNSSIQEFIDVQKQQSLISYNQFVGKEVEWHKVSESDETIIDNGTGKVSSVQFKDNNVIFILEDGTELEPANISQLNEISTENNIVQASMLIGKTVTYLNENNEEMAAAVKSVSFKDGKTQFQLNDEEKTIISSSQISKIE